jgi:hypothetical protein
MGSFGVVIDGGVSFLFTMRWRGFNEAADASRLDRVTLYVGVLRGEFHFFFARIIDRATKKLFEI